MDIVTLAAARKGSGGGASKEYVDEKVAALINDTTAAQDKTYSSAKVEEKVAGEEITTTSTTSPISTANGKPRAITIYGKSEVINGVIKSAGEGYAVVDLGTLNWTYTQTANYSVFEAPINGMFNPTTASERLSGLLCSKYPISTQPSYATMDAKSMLRLGGKIIIKDGALTDATSFKTAMSGVLLCYQLDDPTQGNTIAVKTDNGTGIDGTMATFTTGTPLYGVSDTARDVMKWDGSAGTVTKNCTSIDLGILTWGYANNRFYASANIKTYNFSELAPLICSKYPTIIYINQSGAYGDKTISSYAGYIYVKDTDYEDNISAFTTAISGVKIVYELATPTTESLTQTENESIAGLKTYSPQTVVTINDNPEFEVEAYANTANGQAISDMQPTRSPLLTLSASGWTNNAQTVTYEHDIGRRNTIDVEPTNIKAWTAAGILATSETATSITFECDTVPTSDLSFRVTSMEVR